MATLIVCLPWAYQLQVMAARMQAGAQVDQALGQVVDDGQDGFADQGD